MSGHTTCRPASAASSQPARPDAHWRSLRADGADWIVRHDLAAELLGEAGLRFHEWRRRGQVEIVKTGPHRTVYRLSLPSGEFYVKHFRVPDWRALMRNAARGAPAERELRAAKRMAALRLETFEPVALGRSRRFGVTHDSFLISRAVPDAVPLDHYLLTDFSGQGAGAQATLRQRLARDLGQLAARLHAAGIEHVDLHAGNLLIRPNAGPHEPLLALIDLHAVRFRKSLSRAARDRNLMALHQFFAGRSTLSDRRRFWRAYYAGLRQYGRFAPRIAGDAPRDTTPYRLPVRSSGLRIVPRPATRHAREAARLERLIQQAARAGWRRADRAWRRGNRHVRVFDSRRANCRGLATLEDTWLAAIRDAPESLFRNYAVCWCKDSPRRRVAEVLIPARLPERPGAAPRPSGRIALYAPEASGDVEPIAGFWKCVVERPGLGRWLTQWRLSAVRRAWEFGHALLRRGIDTPRPLVVVEATTGTGRRGYLLTAAVENSVTAQEFFQYAWSALAPSDQGAWLARHGRKLAQQLRRLHDSGFDHRDLKFPNLLVSTLAEDDRVWLLDLDAVRRWPSLPRTRAMQNLSRLNVSTLLIAEIGASARLRFLRHYLGPRFAAEWKIWWRAIAQLSSRKVTRNVRLVRPLS